MHDLYEMHRPLLDLIGQSEGTDRRRGYDETLSYGAYTGGDRKLTAMSLDQVDELQRAMLAHPDNVWNSSALGRYQIVRRTLAELRQLLGLSGHEIFDAQLQDRLAIMLLRRRGFNGWLDGKLSDDNFISNLAREWASLPNAQNVGHYDGQRARVDVSEVRSALEGCRRLHEANDRANEPSPASLPVQAGAVVAAAGACSVPFALAQPEGAGLSVFAAFAPPIVLVAIAVLIVVRLIKRRGR